MFISRPVNHATLKHSFFQWLKRLNGEVIPEINILFIAYFIKRFFGTPVNIKVVFFLFFIICDHIIVINKPDRKCFRYDATYIQGQCPPFFRGLAKWMSGRVNGIY